MRGIRKYTGLLILSLFLSYYGGITLFRHAHQLGDNNIVHSHPHKSGCKHSHSAEELRLIQELSLFLTLAAVLTILIAGRFDLLTAVLPVRRAVYPEGIPLETSGIRGPPQVGHFSV